MSSLRRSRAISIPACYTSKCLEVDKVLCLCCSLTLEVVFPLYFLVLILHNRYLVLWGKCTFRIEIMQFNSSKYFPVYNYFFPAWPVVVKVAETSVGSIQKQRRSFRVCILDFLRQVSVQFIVHVLVVSPDHRLQHFLIRCH